VDPTATTRTSLDKSIMVRNKKVLLWKKTVVQKKNRKMSKFARKRKNLAPKKDTPRYLVKNMCFEVAGEFLDQSEVKVTL
jgi:hypothetical protein